MLSRLIYEFVEIFYGHIAPRLHPRDIAALSMICRHMRMLRTHPVVLHARAFTSSLRALRVPYYACTRCFRVRHYEGDLRAYEIVHCNMSARGHVVYEYVIGYIYNYIAGRRFLSSYEIARVDINETIMPDRHKRVACAHVRCENRHGDTIGMWIAHILTLTSVLNSTMGIFCRMMRYIGARDILALGCTCREMRKWSTSARVRDAS